MAERDEHPEVNRGPGLSLPRFTLSPERASSAAPRPVHQQQAPGAYAVAASTLWPAAQPAPAAPQHFAPPQESYAHEQQAYPHGQPMVMQPGGGYGSAPHPSQAQQPVAQWMQPIPDPAAVHAAQPTRSRWSDARQGPLVTPGAGTATAAMAVEAQPARLVTPIRAAVVLGLLVLAFVVTRGGPGAAPGAAPTIPVSTSTVPAGGGAVHPKRTRAARLRAAKMRAAARARTVARARLAAKDHPRTAAAAIVAGGGAGPTAAAAQTSPANDYADSRGASSGGAAPSSVPMTAGNGTTPMSQQYDPSAAPNGSNYD